MKIISVDQTAFLPLRYILDVLLTNETLSRAKLRNQEVVFLKFDFAKAYDTIV